MTYILQLDIKVPYFPTAFISLISISQPVSIQTLRDLITSKNPAATNTSPFLENTQELEKLRNQEQKFADLITTFDTDEECIEFCVNKLWKRNPTAFAKALKHAQEAQSVSDQPPTQESNRLVIFFIA